jgi:hypothetical protein
MKKFTNHLTAKFARRYATAVLATCFSLVGFSASAASKTGLNTFSFGNNLAGASGSYSINVTDRTGFSHTDLAANGTVKFLNRSVKGVEFTAATENNQGRKSATYSLQVVGYTVDSGTKTVSYTWNKGINQTLVSCSLPLMVGPIPVTISGSIGGGASIGYTLQLATTGVGLSGQAAVWESGSASAGVGAPLLNVALRADLTLGKTSLNPSVNVTPTSMSGQANLQFDPVRIDFSVALQSLGRVWYQQNLSSYSAPSKTVSLIQL